MITRWEVEHAGHKIEVHTTDKTGHSAYAAWLIGRWFFVGAPEMKHCKVTRLSGGNDATV